MARQQEEEAGRHDQHHDVERQDIEIVELIGQQQQTEEPGARMLE